MGIQSDTEMLSVSAVEEYAAQNHIAVDAAYELFHRHQIFEKIILQHEYLHQISMDEVMEFVYRECRTEIPYRESIGIPKIRWEGSV